MMNFVGEPEASAICQTLSVQTAQNSLELLQIHQRQIRVGAASDGCEQSKPLWRPQLLYAHVAHQRLERLLTHIEVRVPRKKIECSRRSVVELSEEKLLYLDIRDAAP
jgi:hypothetical protein